VEMIQCYHCDLLTYCTDPEFLITSQHQWLLLHNFTTSHHLTQEAQLSQRDCAMLRVIEYFAKSLKVIPNDTVE